VTYDISAVRRSDEENLIDIASIKVMIASGTNIRVDQTQFEVIGRSGWDPRTSAGLSTALETAMIIVVI
jgi:hypothetical protein